MADPGVSHLQLVPDVVPDATSSKATVFGVQEPLFSDPSTVLLVALDDARGKSLPDMLERLRPHAVLDLRALPRFDFGRLDRKRFFSLVSELAIEYLDAGLEPGGLVPSSEALAETIHRELTNLSCGPVVVFVDARFDRETAAKRLADTFRNQAEPWVPSLQYR
jgi:hypothetical protein